MLHFGIKKTNEHSSLVLEFRENVFRCHNSRKDKSYKEKCQSMTLIFINLIIYITGKQTISITLKMSLLQHILSKKNIFEKSERVYRKK